MANELETSIRNAALKMSKALEDASELQVDTWYVEVGGDEKVDFSAGQPVAQTLIALDGDSKTVIPMRRQDGNLTLDTELLDLHRQNVTTAIEYRARILNALLTLLPQRGG